jgi:hypothetical protein
MYVFFPQPRFMPCSACGASVAREERQAHICDPERLVDYRLFQLRDDIDALEAELCAYLDTPAGQFEVWYAEKRRLGLI